MSEGNDILAQKFLDSNPPEPKSNLRECYIPGYQSVKSSGNWNDGVADKEIEALFAKTNSKLMPSFQKQLKNYEGEDQDLFKYAALQLLKTQSFLLEQEKLIEIQKAEIKKAQDPKTAAGVDIGKLNIDDRENIKVAKDSDKIGLASVIAVNAQVALMAPLAVFGLDQSIYQEKLDPFASEQMQKQVAYNKSKIDIVLSTLLEEGLDAEPKETNWRGKEVALKFNPNKDFSRSRIAVNADFCLKEMGDVCEKVNNYVGAGITSRTNPAEDKRWLEFCEYRDNFLKDIKNHPSLASFAENRLKDIAQEQAEGKISKAEFEAKKALIELEATEADEKHKEYIASLEQNLKKIDDAMLKQLTEDREESDTLNKYRLLQILLICSPFAPAIPVFGFVFQALHPFLGGVENLGEFVSSFFSTDGPFGQLAFLTDAMEMDKFTDIVLNDWFGGPTEVISTILQNPITTPIMNSVGESAAASALIVIPALIGLEALTGSVQKDADRIHKIENVLPQTKEFFKDFYQKLVNEEELRENKQTKEYLSQELDVAENIFKANKAAEHLLSLKEDGSCDKILENIIKDKDPVKEPEYFKAKDLLSKALEAEDVDEITKVFYENAGLKYSKDSVLQNTLNFCLESNYKNLEENNDIKIQNVNQKLTEEFLEIQKKKYGIEFGTANPQEMREKLLTAMFAKGDHIKKLKDIPVPSPEKPSAEKVSSIGRMIG